MLKIALGEMLRRFRIEKKAGARQLCEGLCSTAMMSYFENGEKVPDVLLFEYLVERMGVSSDLFSIMVSKEEFEYYSWKEQVCEAIAGRDFAKLEKELRSKVTGKCYCNSKLERQFLLYATAINDGVNKEYKVAAKRLEEALQLTIPDVETITSGKMLLSALELHMLMLYLYYGKLGNVMDAEVCKRLFYRLEDYINNARLGFILQSKIYPKLCCIGIALFAEEMTDEEQMWLCDKAIQFMVEDMTFYEITSVLQFYIPLLEKYASEKLSYYQKQYEVFVDIFRADNIDISFCAEEFVIGSPQFYMIHEYLLSKRQVMELTQEKLSEGICEPETYSRVEKGRRAPSRKNFQKLAERLGINWCYYGGELDTANLKAINLRLQQRDAYLCGNDEECLSILQEMERQVDMNSVANIQYIRNNEYVSKCRMGILSEQETYEKLEMLLKLTQNVEYDSSQLVYYSQTELEILAHMAQLLREMGQYEKGIHSIQTVLKQIQNSKMNIRFQWNGISFLLRVLNSLYFEIHDYEVALQIAQYVQRENVKRREGCNLIETLDGMADALEHMGEQYSEEYKKLYRHTVYVAEFFRMKKMKELMQKFYQDNFEPNIQWY